MSGDARHLTFGVEEEFLLLDAATGSAAEQVEAVIPRLSDDIRRRSQHEYHLDQLELITDICDDLSELHRQLVQNRVGAAEVAAQMGIRVVSIGAAPTAISPAAITPDPRYLAIDEHFGPVAPVSCCGCHVHVGVADRDTAVRVCNHLRPWLPVVQALCSNSPLHAGIDTGYASWRSMVFGQWPSTGLTPWCESEAEYLGLLDRLIDSGMMLDVAMAYWYARPSLSYPTVEVRIGDACPTAAEAALAAGIVRGLVAAILDDLDAGTPPERVTAEMLTAAHWRAAHEGMSGTLLDARTGHTRPAWELADDLMVKISAPLVRHGDLDIVQRGLKRIQENGTGADRQRRVFHDAGTVDAVLDYLAAETTSPAY
jgi:carboxylate-amine ligase